MEILEFDVIIVGAGVAGLSSAIKLKQLSPELEICVLEKAAEIGGHIISGAVIEVSALNELLPNWQELNAPIKTKVSKDELKFLSTKKAFNLPIPKILKNDDNYIISLGHLVKWLGEQAENLGVQVFAGFSAKEAVIENEKLVGVKTMEFGLDKTRKEKEDYQPSIFIKAKYTVLAEGARGSVTKKVIEYFDLRANRQEQTYGLGLKEVWKIDSKNFEKGKVTHSIGFPLDSKTYGGGFIYHYDENLVSIGLIIGLDYENPYLNTFKTFQKFKTHPEIAKILENGERISYGARVINEGGIQSIPKLHFNGGAIIGCSAGFVNIAKIKGIHNAMKSGMLLSEEISSQFNQDGDLQEYQTRIKNSSIYKELYKVRNIRPAFKYGMFFGLLNASIESFLLKGKGFWSFSHKHKGKDNLSLKLAKNAKKLDYDKPDNKLTFDLSSSTLLSNVHHEEDQPCHLQVQNMGLWREENLEKYASPESNYCPAGVYEVVKDDKNNDKLQINAINCVHCKACDVKDVKQNINWQTPEAGGGVNYEGM